MDDAQTIHDMAMVLAAKPEPIVEVRKIHETLRGAGFDLGGMGPLMVADAVAKADALRERLQLARAQ